MKKLKLLTGLIFLALCSGANAESLNTSGYYYGLNYYSYSEKTATQNPFMEEKTTVLPTVLLGYRNEESIRSATDRDSLSWFTEAAVGQVEYSQYTGVGTHDHNYWKFQTEAVYPLPKNFYIGAGYRYLMDYLSDYGTGGYDRENELFYIPVGYIQNIADGTSIKYQYNYLIEGTQTSHTTDLGYNSDLDNKQDSGFGVDIAYQPNKSDYELFVKYWHIDDSDWNTVQGLTAMEPDNTTWEIGLKWAF